MNPAVASLLRRWIQTEATGLLFCDILADEVPAARKAKWQTMGELERCMFAKISAQLDVAADAATLVESAAEAKALACSYIDMEERQAAAWLAGHVQVLLESLQDEVAGLGRAANTLCFQLVAHEEAWIDFLRLEASGDAEPHRTALRLLAEMQDGETP